MLTQLTSLEKVNQYDSQPLRILIADSNQIHSIMDLSGSVFIRRFSRFSLQHNFVGPHDVRRNQTNVLLPFGHDHFQ